MRTLTIPISDVEFNKFGFKSNKINFSDFVEIINKELLKTNFRKSVELAEKYNLSEMTMEEISNEVKSVRNNAKSYN